MKTRTGKLAIVIAAWFLALALGRASFADDAVPSEKRLPQETVMFLSLRNFSDFKTQWSKTLFGQLEKEEALAEFRDDFVKQFEEASKEFEGEVGVSLPELFAIPHGEMTLAMFTGAAGQLSIVVMLDFGDREETVQKLLAKAGNGADNSGFKHSEEEIDDTRVNLYQKEGDGVPGLHDAYAYFVKDSFFVLGNSLDALKPVLSRWDGKHDSTLSESDVYRYIVDRCRDENSEAQPQLVWFIDPLTLVRSVFGAQPQAAAQMALVMGMLPTLGVDKFKGAGGTLDMAHGEFDMVSRTLVYMERPTKGLLNLFQFNSGAQAPPKWLSSEWSSYSSVNWSVSKAYSAVEGLIDMFQGPGTLAQIIQRMADDGQFGNIHLKKDILDQLTGKIDVVQDDGEGKGILSSGVLVAAGVKNAAAFQKTLAKLARIDGVKLEEREFQGETIYELDLPGLGAFGNDDDDDDDDDDEGGESNSKTFGIAVAENHLLLASDVRLIERVLRGVDGRETLADSAAYKRISGKFPAQTASIGYTRQDSILKALYQLTNLGKLGMGPDLSAFGFSKLPPIDTLKKYMPASGSFMEHDERGLRITSF